MRALVSRPPAPGLEFLEDAPRPELSAGAARVRVLEVGICGTDLDIVAGRYGRAPAGATYLILGHENLGEVVEVQETGSSVRPGDLVVATVRRGCGSCPFCAAGRSDFCASGGYTERGIWGAHGYLAEEYVERTSELVVVPRDLRAAAVLTEPLSVVEKALEQGGLVRARYALAESPASAPGAALVAGAGAIGVLASLVLRERGWAVTTIDRHPSSTPASEVLARAGATHVDVAPGLDALGAGRFDLIVEASGSAQLDAQLLDRLGTNGVLVLTGIPDAASAPAEPLGARLRRLVLSNQAIVGSVNANRTHFAAAVADLERLSARWPGLADRLVGPRRPWTEAAAVFAGGSSGAIKRVLVVGDDDAPER